MKLVYALGIRKFKRRPPRHMRSVYLIGSKEHDWFKIGVSNHPEYRMSTFQASLPFQVTLLATGRFANLHAFIIEKALHKHFAAKRAEGEWFRGIAVPTFERKMKEFAQPFK